MKLEPFELISPRELFFGFMHSNLVNRLMLTVGQYAQAAPNDMFQANFIFSFIRHLGSNTIITIKETKVLVYEIISNSITK